jgi:hypothetical protein
VEIATHVCEFFRPHMLQIGQLMTQVVDARGMEDTLQKLAIAFFMAAATDTPQMVACYSPRRTALRADGRLGLAQFRSNRQLIDLGVRAAQSACLGRHDPPACLPA